MESMSSSARAGPGSEIGHATIGGRPNIIPRILYHCKIRRSDLNGKTYLSICRQNDHVRRRSCCWAWLSLAGFRWIPSP